MAVGGWIHYPGWCSLSSDDDAGYEHFVDDITACITSMPNWAVKAARTKYVTNGWFVTYANSVTGAELAVIVLRYCVYGTFLHSTNNVLGSNLSGSDYDHTRWIAYCPPGATFAATNPATSGFVPAQGFLFQRWDSHPDFTYLGGQHRMHCLVRDDDDLIITWSDNADEDPQPVGVFLMGGCAVPCHASDSGSRKNEAMIGVAPQNNLSSGSAGVYSQFFKADNTTRILSGAVKCQGWQFSIVQNYYHHLSPWIWNEGVFYKSGNPTADGVVVGNGIKGALNHEWYRFLQYWGAVTLGEQFDSGNFVCIRGVALIGWDPSNGPMV